MSEGDFVWVMSVADLPEGRMRACQVAGRDIVVCHLKGGAVYALDDVCTHAFARMSEGRLRGTRLMCPMHGASFDVRNGGVLGAPATQPLTTHAVRIVEGAVEVAINANSPAQPLS